MIPKLKFVAKTHKGLIREENEDCFLCEPELGLFLVADGMGGHEAGEIASKIACNSIKDFVKDAYEKGIEKFPITYRKDFPLEWNILLGALSYANGNIIKYSEKKRYLTGMGTTVVACLFRGRRLSYAHVGDSRLYVFKENSLKLLTEDHSWIQEQIKLGNITEEEAKYHPLKNVITRALGGSTKISIDIADIQIKNGDKFLLCSDGLNVVLSEDLMERIIIEEKDLEKCADRLIEETLKMGGPDNVTLIIIEVCLEG